jgi:hypothetical protein
MSWRDARAKVDRGFYKPKQESPLATGFAAAADIVATSWIKDAAEEKEAEKIRLKEEKAERKRIRAAQQKADEKQKKENQAVNSIIRRQGLDPSKITSDFRSTLLEEVQLMGASDAITFYADNKVNPEYAYGSPNGTVEAAAPVVLPASEENSVPTGVGSLDAAEGNTSVPTFNNVGSLDAAESSVEDQTDSMLSENDTGAPVDGTDVKIDDKKPVPMFQVKKPEINFKDLTTPALAEQEAIRVEKDFPELAEQIRAYGNGLIKDISVTEVEAMGETGRNAALADPNITPENKAIIKRWIAENDTVKLRDAAKIDYNSITLDNYIQMAEGFRNNTQLENGEELAKKVEAVGQLIKDANNKPLTLTELDALDLDILEGAVAAGKVEEDQEELFNKVIERKYNALGRDLSGKDDDYLAGVRDNPFNTEAEKNAAIAVLAGRKDNFDIKEWDTIKGPTLDVAIGVATGEMKVQLEALKKARATIPSEMKLDMSAGFLMTTYTVDNVTYIATAAPTENGQLYDIDRQKLIPIEAKPQSTSIKTLGAQASLVAQMNDKVLIPLTESRREMAYMLQSAQRLEKFVNPTQGGNPEILTTIGGDITRLLSRIDNEYAALNKMFLSGKTEDEVFSYIDSSMDGIKGISSASSQFQAEVLKFAYLYATVSLEQRGAGLSNTDFANALNIVKAGSDYGTFSGNLRARAKEGIDKVEGRISDITNTSAQIKLLDKLDPSRELSSGYKTTAKDYLTGRGLGDMYTYAYSELPTSVEEKNPNSNTTAPKKPIGQVVTEYKASNVYAKEAEIYTQLPTEKKQEWAELMALKHGIPIELIIKSYGELN